MDKTEDKASIQSGFVFFLFCVWSLILLCRPQDYLHFLAPLRPTLTVGLFTLLVYLLGSRRNERVMDNRQFRLFLYFLAIMVFGVPFSLYRSASLKDVLNYACIYLPFFYLFYQLVTTPGRIRSLLFVCCCGTALYALFIMKLGAVYNGRIAFGTMFDPNDTAFFIICFVAFNLLFLTRSSSVLTKIIVFINIIVCLVVLLKSGSRSGFLAAVALFAYLTMARTRTLNIPFGVKAFLAMAAVVAFLAFGLVSDRYRTILDYEDDYNVTAETGRVTIWKIGIRLLLARPLTGVGMNRFNEGVGRDREERGLLSTQWQAPHNSLVQVGAETGVVGLILFFLMSYRIFTITGMVKKRARSEELVRIAEMARAGFLGHAVSAMFISQAYSIYWVFYLVLSAVLQHMLEKEQSAHENIEIESGLYPYADNLRRG